MEQPFIAIGQAPWAEQCAQVGDLNYRIDAVRECQAFIQAIRNYLRWEPPGARLDVMGFDHEDGTYFEVVCFFDAKNRTAAEFARHCERQAPHTWAEGGVKPPPPYIPSQRCR